MNKIIDYNIVDDMDGKPLIELKNNQVMFASKDAKFVIKWEGNALSIHKQSHKFPGNITVKTFMSNVITVE
jgi:hypothetical protein